MQGINLDLNSCYQVCELPLYYASSNSAYSGEPVDQLRKANFLGDETSAVTEKSKAKQL